MKFVHVNAVNTPINHLSQQFSSTIKQLQEKFVPNRISSSCYSQPWFNRESKRMLEGESVFITKQEKYV